VFENNIQNNNNVRRNRRNIGSVGSFFFYFHSKSGQFHSKSVSFGGSPKLQICPLF
jgi:hypothetical protein